MTIQRYNKPALNFTMIPNERWGNTGLSPMADYVHLYLMTKPREWHVRNSEIAKTLGLSEATARRCLDELCAKGFAKRVAIRGSGRFKQWDVEVHEYPVFAMKSNTIGLQNTPPVAQNTTGGDLSALVRLRDTSKTRSRVSRELREETAAADYELPSDKEAEVVAYAEHCNRLFSKQG